MCWSKSILTVCRAVFMPTLISARMTGSASGFNSPSRREARFPYLAADRRRAAQDLGAVALGHADRADALARLRHLDVGLHFLALEYGVAVMRRQAAGLEPCLAPDALAQRRELAEMGRAFDGAALEPELLRGRIVVDRGMGVVDLRVEHLLRAAPRPGEHIVALQYLGVKACFIPGSPFAPAFQRRRLRQGASQNKGCTRDMPAAMN